MWYKEIYFSIKTALKIPVSAESGGIVVRLAVRTET